MELKIAATNMELTPEMRSHIEQKLGKLGRHYRRIMETKAEVTREDTKSPGKRYLVRATVTTSSNARFHSEERGEDLFTAVDRVAEVLLRQIDDYKDKLYEKGRMVSVPRGVANRLGLRVQSETAAAEAAESAAARLRVSEVKRQVVKPMSVEEAIEQMKLLGENFFMFLNPDTEGLSLVYRRKGGQYGIVEAEM